MADVEDSDSEVEEWRSKRHRSNQKVKSRPLSESSLKNGNGRSAEQTVRVKWVKEADVEGESELYPRRSPMDCQ